MICVSKYHSIITIIHVLSKFIEDDINSIGNMVHQGTN